MKKYTLEEVIDALLGENGCPWDKAQTVESLRRYILEETYELLEAIASGDDKKHMEELGDLLYHIHLQAALKKRQGAFDLEDVKNCVAEKLVSRHPNVFDDADDSIVNEKNWEERKLLQKGKSSLMDDIPDVLPALSKSEKIQRRASVCGFDWPTYEGPRNKVIEELTELDEAFSQNDSSKISEELGDLLFSVSNLARHLGVNSEIALNDTNQKFMKRFRLMESMVEEEGLDLRDLTLDQQDCYWVKAKNTLKNPLESQSAEELKE
ncbi:MAG: nucleoside triphosphate pyrophosphohydrolase [Deltaproteobacteria bacterium]|nr:nucleoside triphosphate pyrophosphohydrolase [Deltaproteobacteria bacterium]